MAEELPQMPGLSEPPEEPGFDALRRWGIDLAQALAAENWTDFNLHDPGVTLLEQLCFGITDLIHRTGFDVADHLSSPDGVIDFDRLGLEMPERIFPCRPTTLTDYRQAIIDAVADVDDVLFEVEPSHEVAGVPLDGLYRILIRPRPGTSELDKARIRSQVTDTYASLRNLCEDAQAIGFVDEVEFELRGEVEVTRDRNPAAILAEIYHHCAERIAARLPVHPFEHARRSDLSLERLFTGPLGQHGFFREEDLRRAPTSHSVAGMFALVKDVQGVDYVRDLYFQQDGHVERENISAGGVNHALRLRIPNTPDEIGIHLTSQGRRLQLSLESFRNELDMLALRARGGGRAKQDVSKLYARPRGEYRDLRQYTSIQHHLPAIFGLGGNASQTSRTVAERARAKQLNGYLLLFDQLMANYTAQLADLRGLYARDIDRSCSYASQAVDQDGKLGLERIYPQWRDRVLAEVSAAHDHFTERKGRQLDYLLALYGERFSQHSLRAFDIYADPGEQEQRLLSKRAEFLRAVVQLTRDRGAAFDYRAPGGASLSGLHLRVSHLLGFTDHRQKSLTSPLGELELVPVPADRASVLPGDSGPRVCAVEELQTPANPWEAEIPILEAESSLTDRESESLTGLFEELGDLLPHSNGKLDQGILRTGVSLGNYRLGQEKEKATWQAYLNAPDGDCWWRLADFQKREDAVRAVNRLRRLLLLLNTASEGMHVVEHVLLRPRGNAATEGSGFPVENDFFPFRLSVVFPDWTARFQDERFRQFVRETVGINCPAHLTAEVLWLDYDDMLTFEQLQEDWLNALAADPASEADLNEAAQRMLRFLLARRGEACWALEAAAEAGQREIG